MQYIRFRYIELFSKNYDLKKRYKNFNLKYRRNLWTDHVAQRTQPRSIQNLPLGQISKRLSQFYSRNRSTYKTHFFHFSNFFSKNNQQNGLKFSQIIAIYILHYRDFSPQNWPFSLGVISFKKKKHLFGNNKRTAIAREIIFILEYRFFYALSNATHPTQKFESDH